MFLGLVFGCIFFYKFINIKEEYFFFYFYESELTFLLIKVICNGIF